MYFEKQKATKRKMVFPGTFDPLTKGHLNIIERALTLCDELVVAVFDNGHKTPVIPMEKRVALIRKALTTYPSVFVTGASGLLVHFCREQGIDTIVRGVRGAVQCEEESRMAEINHLLNERVETILLPSRAAFHHLSSSLVREIAGLGESIAALVPEEIYDEITALYGIHDGEE